MKAVILAAGKGERLFPFTVGRSKALVPIAGRPLIWYITSALSETEVREAIFVISEGSDIKEYLDSRNLPFPVSFSVQRKQLGTGDALLAARDHISKGERFLALNGDIVLAPSVLRRLLRRARRGLAIAVVGVPDVSEYGAAIIENGRLRAIREKAEYGRGFANAGIYVLDYQIFGLLEKLKPSPRGELELTDGINALVSAGRGIAPVKVARQKWCDVGRPWDIIAATKLALREYGTPPRVPTPVISERAVVKGSFIGAGAVIEEAKVFNSVIMERAKIAAGARVSWSVIGERVYVGERVTIRCKLPNYVKEVTIGGRVVKARRRLIGAFIGTEARVSSDITLPPASFVAPGEVL